jgi:hypothetical protein
MKDIKEDGNRWGARPCSWTGRRNGIIASLVTEF